MTTDLRFLRQLDAVNMERLAKLQVTLIGAGSIGSTTALWLAKMGVQHLRIFDSDTVEEHNQPNQLYRGSDIGQNKVAALEEIILQSEGYQIEAVAERYFDQLLTEVVISGVDSMTSRTAIWKSVRSQKGVKLYIDARMGLETLVVHTVFPTDREQRIAYRKTLYNDEEAFQEPCTARTICYTPLMASAVICNLIKRYISGQALPKQVTLDLATFTILTQES